MNRKIGVTCPYCGHQNYIHMRDDYEAKAVITCDEMEGGCGSDFVVKASVEIKVKTLEIIGEGWK